MLKSKISEKGIIHATTGIIEKREYVQKVQFAVWSEDGGQDDLIWYDISPNADGEYEKDIFISNHKYALGKYYVHIYITVLLEEDMEYAR